MPNRLQAAYERAGTGLMLEYLFFWSLLSVSCFSLTKTLPHAFVCSPALWHCWGKGGISYIWPATPEARWNEARCGAGGKTDINGVREKRKEGTTPCTDDIKYIKKSASQQPNQPCEPCPVCAVCTVEETACSDGEMALMVLTFRNHLHGKRAVLLKHDRFSCFRHLLPGGGCCQGKCSGSDALYIAGCSTGLVWTKQWKVCVHSLLERVSPGRMALKAVKSKLFHIKSVDEERECSYCLIIP